MGLGTSTHRYLHSFRLCGSKVRPQSCVHRNSERHRRQSTFILLAVVVCSSFLGSSCIRLLCLLSRDNVKVQGIHTYSYWTYAVFHSCQHSWSWTRIWNRQQLDLERCLQCLFRRSYTRWIRGYECRIHKVLWYRHCIRSNCKQHPRNLLSSSRLPNAWPLPQGYSTLLVDHRCGSYLLHLRHHRTRPPIHHLPELLGLDGILDHGIHFYCS